MKHPIYSKRHTMGQFKWWERLALFFVKEQTYTEPSVMPRDPIMRFKVWRGTHYVTGWDE